MLVKSSVRGAWLVKEVFTVRNNITYSLFDYGPANVSRAQYELEHVPQDWLGCHEQVFEPKEVDGKPPLLRFGYPEVVPLDVALQLCLEEAVPVSLDFPRASYALLNALRVCLRGNEIEETHGNI